jgi:hypothetical protein
MDFVHWTHHHHSATLSPHFCHHRPKTTPNYAVPIQRRFRHLTKFSAPEPQVSPCKYLTPRRKTASILPLCCHYPEMMSNCSFPIQCQSRRCSAIMYTWRSSPPSVLLQTPFLMPLRLPELPQSLSDIILDTGACRYQRLRAPHSAIFSCLYLSLLAISLFSRSQISFDVLYILVPLKMYHVLNSRNPFEFI